MTELEYCPRCEIEVSVESPWDETKCPKCDLTCYWEEAYSEGDCWAVLHWRRINK